MGTAIGYVIGSIVSVVLVYLTVQRKGWSVAERDVEARLEHLARVERYDREREERMAEYAQKWRKKGILEPMPLAAKTPRPFMPRLVKFPKR